MVGRQLSPVHSEQWNREAGDMRNKKLYAGGGGSGSSSLTLAFYFFKCIVLENIILLKQFLVTLFVDLALQLKTIRPK